MESGKKKIRMRRNANAERKKYILPPCRVCRSPGAGCHYGVVTCGGCKGFFHRALHYPTQYKCERNERCDIKNVKGKLCQKCRYQTCLAVGMSKDAIKTGRYTLKERTKYILEIQGLLNGSKRKTSQKAENKQKAHIQNDFHGQIRQSTSTSAAESNRSQVTQMTTTSSLVLPDVTQHHPHDPIQSPKIGNTHLHHGTSLPIQYSSDADGPSNEDTKRNPSSCDYSPVSHHFFDSSLPPEKQKYITNLYSNKTAVVKTLMDSHERNLGSFWKMNPNRNILEETERHYELCKQEKSVHEDPLKGIVTDNASRCNTTHDNFFGVYGKEVELFIRKMVCFIKSVPGFSCLGMTDKINLIKLGRREFAFLSSYEDTNWDLGVVFAFTSKGWLCPNDLIRSNLEEKLPLLRKYVKLSRKLQELNLSKEEVVLLKTMSILSPDRVTARNSSMLQEIYWRLTQLLLFQLNKRQKKPWLVFAKIVDILTEFRTTEFEINNFILGLNLRQNDFDDLPITKEMLTGFVFSGDDL